MYSPRPATLLAGFLVFAVASTLLAAEPQPKFRSPLVTRETPGRAVAVEADIRGAKQLFLVVADGGDGYGCDWADWAEPRLVGPKGEKKLTDLKWKSAESGWGKPHVNRNAQGDALRINSQPVEYGIGTHANSVIAFDLPEGYTTFKSRAGLDNGGTDQGCGSSVRFLIFTEKPNVGQAFQPASSARQAGKPAPHTPADGSHQLKDAIAGLDVAPGLEVTLFAGEPTLLSPSNIDVDHLGRVWVCEVVNYRRFANKERQDRPEGDRILVLEDTDGDGQCDKSTTFYQGRDVDSAHGVCVLGERVIISCGDSVFSLYDRDGDLKADPGSKEILFTGISGTQHDHGIHAFVFGPDGKLYFNFGNAGQQIKDKHGRPIIDKAGNEINDHRQPYQEGMVFRCNLDGSEVETLAWNFRNNWEVCVDSFGTLWQSDNDDDGNRGVRINYVMEFGNYGYKDELTGAGWKTPRTNLEAEIPLQHWHLNDPGVVPNLLLTGAGSPTGICVYEGDLLPEVYRNQIIHCDAGPNVVRCYPVKEDGAGYTAEIVNILEGTRDKWFRPSDVCVAPDGSLIIADWYDPGVGGHRQGDVDKGRLFRVAPKGVKYKIPKTDFSTVEGAIAALKSPNLATRYLAYQSLWKRGTYAESQLVRLFNEDPNPRLRARAAWLLSSMGVINSLPTLGDAQRGPVTPLRVMAIRETRELEPERALAILEQSIHDVAPAVRRQIAVALHRYLWNAEPSIERHDAARLWAELAVQHTGNDRWYLEALGIGAGTSWDDCLALWLDRIGDRWNTPAGRDIIWRSRAKQTPDLLVKIISDPETTIEDLPRYFRALDFQTGAEKDSAVTQLAFNTQVQDEHKQALIVTEAVNRLQGFDLAKHPEHKAALEKVLDQTGGTSQFVTLVDRFNLADRYPELLALAQSQPDQQVGVEAIRTLLGKQQRELLRDALRSEDESLAINTAKVLGLSADGRALSLLDAVMNDDKRPLPERQEAVRGLARMRKGAEELIELARAKKLDENLKQAAAFSLHGATWDDIRQQAAQLFPLPPSKNDRPLPPVSELLKRKGNAERGKAIYATTGTCAKCHIVNNEGKEVGPNLSEIGSKLSREALFESILYPSAGISHNYETYALALTNGDVVTGLIATQTPESVSIKGADALVRTIRRSEIDELAKQPVSLMPADLQKQLTADDLVDVIEYLQTLTKK